MKTRAYLRINSRGSVKVTKSPTGLDWDEIAIMLSLDVPDALFQRPLLEAKIEVGNDVIPKPQPMELILNSRELIEQSTGAKIDFSVVPYEEEK